MRLLTGSRLEFYDQFSGYLPAIFHLDVMRLGPLPDLGGVQPARRSPAPPRAGRREPPSPHVGRQRVTQLLGMLSVQVDLILCAVQPEADALSRTR